MGKNPNETPDGSEVPSQKSSRVAIEELSYSDADSDSVNESELQTLYVNFRSQSELFPNAEHNTRLPWAKQPRGRIYRAPAFHNRTELKKLFREITQCPDQTPIKIVEEPQHPVLSPNNQNTSKIKRRWKEVANCNIVLSQKSIRKGKLVGRDKVLAKYLGLQPQNMRYKRSMTAFGLFVNIKNYFYGPNPPPIVPRVTKIKFPEEIIELAEQHGDRAGRDRTVTLSTYPSRRSRRMKLRKVYDKKRGRTIIDPEIRDDNPNDEPDGCCEWFIQNYLTEGICLHSHRKKFIGPGDEHWSYRYSQAVYKFGYNLEIATDYVDGMMKSVRGAENRMRFPVDSEVTESLNYISAQIWIETYAMKDLFSFSEGNEGRPTKSEFDAIISRMEQVTTDAEHLAERAISFAPHFCDFGKEVLSHLSKAGKALGIKVDTSVSKPIQKFSGLKILKKTKELKLRDAILLKVVARSKIGIKPEWENFSSYPKQFRLFALEGLGENAEEAVHKLRNQLRFVYEDVATQRFDDEEPPFMTICILLQDLIRFFVDSEETSKAHMENLTLVMGQFIEQTRDFILRTQEMLVSMVEISDMAQLCMDYMQEEYNVNMVDYSHQKMKTLQIAHGCWVTFKKFCLRRKEGPHYKAEDFMHTQYRDALLLHWVSVGTAYLFLKPTAVDEIEEKKEKVPLRFAAPDLELNDSVIFELKDKPWQPSEGEMTNPFVNDGTVADINNEGKPTPEGIKHPNPHSQQQSGSPEIISILHPPKPQEHRRWSENVPLIVEPRPVVNTTSGSTGSAGQHNTGNGGSGKEIGESATRKKSSGHNAIRLAVSSGKIPTLPLQPILKSKPAPFHPNPQVEMPKVSIKWSKKRQAREASLAQQQQQQHTKTKVTPSGQADPTGHAPPPKEAGPAHVPKQPGQAPAPKQAKSKSKQAVPKPKAASPAVVLVSNPNPDPTAKRNSVILKVKKRSGDSVILQLNPKEELPKPTVRVGDSPTEKWRRASKLSIAKVKKTSSKNELKKTSSKMELKKTSSKMELKKTSSKIELKKTSSKNELKKTSSKNELKTSSTNELPRKTSKLELPITSIKTEELPGTSSKTAKIEEPPVQNLETHTAKEPTKEPTKDDGTTISEEKKDEIPQPPQPK